MKVAFIGLGNMGGPMAANLLKAGFEVQVFDLLPDNMQALCDQGASATKSASQAISGAQVVVSMLPAGKHVKSLYLEDNEVSEALTSEMLIIDSSTIDAQTARQVAAQLADRGVDFIDAPVSGGVAGAQAGTLTFIVGGEQAQFEKARPVLSAMGSNIFHAGGHAPAGGQDL